MLEKFWIKSLEPDISWGLSWPSKWTLGVTRNSSARQTLLARNTFANWRIHIGKGEASNGFERRKRESIPKGEVAD